MHKIFNGLLLALLDFDITFGAEGTHILGLIPDFVGYILIRLGLDAMVPYSKRFARARPWVTGMVIYTAALYVSDLVGLSAMLGTAVTLPLGLLSIAVSLKITFEIAKGVADMESAVGLPLNADSLRLFWIWMAFASFGTILLFQIFPELSLASMLIGLISNIAFLFSFHKAKNLFDEHQSRIPVRRDP